MNATTADPPRKHYVSTHAFHACDTCGAPCCGKGWYPGTEQDLDEFDRAEGWTVEERQASFQHHMCEHTNNACSCGGTFAPAERVGNLDGDIDAGWW